MPSRFEFERAVRGSELPPLSRLLALTVATWADARTGIIPDRLQPSLTTLEESTGLSRASVRTHLNNLEDGKWLGRDRPSVAAARAEKARTKYKIRVPKGSAVSGTDEIELGQDITTARAGAALAAQELGQEVPQPRAGAALELGQEMTTTRAGAALSSSSSAVSSVEYHYTAPAAADRPRANEDALRTVQPLIEEMGRRGMRVGWQMQAGDWKTIANLIHTRSVPVLVDYAERVWTAAANKPYSVRYFLPGWASLPETTATNTPMLRPVAQPSPQAARRNASRSVLDRLTDELRTAAGGDQ